MSRIDIHDEINTLCAKLGIEPTNVAHIDFKPTIVIAIVYRTNEHGSKYLDDDGEVALDALIFEVTT
jgi:hypothetical protein